MRSPYCTLKYHSNWCDAPEFKHRKRNSNVLRLYESPGVPGTETERYHLRASVMHTAMKNEQL